MPADHRVILDPSILGRMALTMETIQAGWETDVAAIGRLQAELSDTRRLLDAAADRADGLQGDNASLKQQNLDLIHRNAYLEEQYRRLFDCSIDARDALNKLAGRVADSARASAPVTAESQPKAPVPTPKPEVPVAEKRAPLTGIEAGDDGTGLPQGRPSFLDHGRTMPPINEFVRQPQTAGARA